MATAFNGETGTVVVIGSPLESDEHEREHLEFLVQELLDILSGVSVLPRPISCLIHLELMAALKESQFKMAQLVESAVPQFEAYQRGESTEEDFLAAMEGSFEDVKTRIVAASDKLEELIQATMQQMLAEAFSETLEDKFDEFKVTEEELKKFFSSLPVL